VAYYFLDVPNFDPLNGPAPDITMSAYDGEIRELERREHGGSAAGKVIPNPTPEQIQAWVLSPHADQSKVRTVTDPAEAIIGAKQLNLPTDNLETYTNIPQEEINAEANRDAVQEREDYLAQGATGEDEAPQKGGLDDPEVVKDILEQDEVKELIEAKLAAGKEKDVDAQGNPVQSPLTSALGMPTNYVGGNLFPSGRNYGVTSLMGARAPVYGPGSQVAGSSAMGAYPRDVDGRVIPWVDAIPDTKEEAFPFTPGFDPAPDDDDEKDPNATGDIVVGSEFYSDPDQFQYLFGGKWINPPPSDTQTVWQDPITGETFRGHQKDRDIFGFPGNLSGFNWEQFAEAVGVTDWETGTVSRPADLEGVAQPEAMSALEWLGSSQEIQFPGEVWGTGDEMDPANPLYRGVSDYDDTLLRAQSTPWAYYGDDLQEFFASPFDAQYSLGRIDDGTGYADSAPIYPNAFNNIFDTNGDGIDDRGLDAEQIRGMVDPNSSFLTPGGDTAYDLDPRYNWFDYEAAENMPYYQYAFRDQYGERPVFPGGSGETFNDYLDIGGNLSALGNSVSAVDFMPTTPGDEVFNLITGWLKDNNLDFNPPPWAPGHNPDLDILGRPAGARNGLTWYDFATSNDLNPETGVPLSGNYNEATGWQDWAGFADKVTLESLGFGGETTLPAPVLDPLNPDDEEESFVWSPSAEAWYTLGSYLNDPETMAYIRADNDGDQTYNYLLELGLLDPESISLIDWQRNIWPSFYNADGMTGLQRLVDQGVIYLDPSWAGAAETTNQQRSVPSKQAVEAEADVATMVQDAIQQEQPNPVAQSISSVANKFFEEPGAIPATDISGQFDEDPSGKLPRQQDPAQQQPTNVANASPLSAGISVGPAQNMAIQQGIKRRGLFGLV